MSQISVKDKSNNKGTIPDGSVYVESIDFLAIKHTTGARALLRAIALWISEFFLKDGRVFESFSGMALMGWGVLKLISDHDDAENFPSLTLLGALNSHVSWGWIGFLIGALQIALLILGRRRIRAIPAVFASVFYGILTQALWAVSPGNPLVAMPAVAFLVSGYLFVPLVRNRNG